ncbi:MAG: tRNA pseudouridine(55) synthase TruB [Spirochaetales bacterium]|nr:tRNA pseudouridine(55) synthase TruB [Spirochaetales bacterium]
MGRNAILLADKAAGVTSFDCLGRIKREINRKSGHCGTLDKFAHGLMIVLCGCYTHLVPAFMGLDKTYEALIEFGRTTDTLDPEGEVIQTGPVPSFEAVSAAVSALTGPQMQVPPIYSALHVDGKRSYRMARSGQEVDLPPRSVIIHEAEILSWEAPFLKIRLHVSKGTYIRSYARDIGRLCGSCAYVKELYRTQIGPFSVSEALPAADGFAGKVPESGNIGEALLERLPGMAALDVSPEEAFKASNGYLKGSVLQRFPEGCRYVVLKDAGKTVCVCSAEERKIICQVREE